MAILKNTTINDIQFLTLPNGSRSQRTGSNSGELRHNSDSGRLEGFVNNTWSGRPTATGGTTTTFGNYTVHAFTSDGTFTVTQGGLIDVLLVAGGGSGGNDNAAGGGGGGVLFRRNFKVATGSYTIDIGNGGAIVGGEAQGLDGQNTTAFGLTAIGGGGGGGGNGGQDGRNGGSGGGAAGEGQPNTVGLGTEGQGFPGGQASTDADGVGGGGGGAGQRGGDAGANGVGNLSGNGGRGVYYGDIFGTSYGESGWFAGGGAGAVGNGPTPGSPPAGWGEGGQGGGGDHGKVTAYLGESGAANTGGGGAGGAYDGANYQNPGAGGSGIVLIRYLT